jgi:hypothetical protein
MCPSSLCPVRVSVFLPDIRKLQSPRSLMELAATEREAHSALLACESSLLCSQPHPTHYHLVANKPNSISTWSLLGRPIVSVLFSVLVARCACMPAMLAARCAARLHFEISPYDSAWFFHGSLFDQG